MLNRYDTNCFEYGEYLLQRCFILLLSLHFRCLITTVQMTCVQARGETCRQWVGEGGIVEGIMTIFAADLQLDDWEC